MTLTGPKLGLNNITITITTLTSRCVHVVIVSKLLYLFFHHSLLALWKTTDLSYIRNCHKFTLSCTEMKRVDTTATLQTWATSSKYAPRSDTLHNCNCYGPKTTYLMNCRKKVFRRRTRFDNSASIKRDLFYFPERLNETCYTSLIRIRNLSIDLSEYGCLWAVRFHLE